MIIQGHFLDGITSNRANARLEVIRGIESTIRLTVTTGNNDLDTQDFAFDDLKIESRLGNTPREIVIGKKGLFITDDHSGTDALIQLIHPRPKSHGLIHKFESNLAMVCIGLVVCGLFSWLGVVYGVPKAANYLAFQMPTFVQDNIGSSLSILDKTLFNPSKLSEEEQARITALVAPYNDQYKHLNPKLNFRLGMGANAFALPSGDIVFTDDFVELTESDDELLAVYFHEVGHLAHKHMMRRALQAAILSITIVLISGDVEHFDIVAGLPALLADLSYSREFEREADNFAFNSMQEHNIPLINFSNVMQKLEDFYFSEEKENGKEGEDRDSWLKYLSTHPGTKERVSRVNEIIESQKSFE